MLIAVISLEISGFFINTNNAVLNNHDDLTVRGVLRNEALANVYNHGTVINEGTIENESFFVVEAGGQLQSNGELSNRGTVANHGHVEQSSKEGVTRNLGPGTMTTSGTWWLDRDATYNNEKGATATITASGVFSTLEGFAKNASRWYVDGSLFAGYLGAGHFANFPEAELFIETGGQMLACGFVDNYGYIDNGRLALGFGLLILPLSPAFASTDSP